MTGSGTMGTRITIDLNQTMDTRITMVLDQTLGTGQVPKLTDGHFRSVVTSGHLNGQVPKLTNGHFRSVWMAGHELTNGQFWSSSWMTQLL